MEVKRELLFPAAKKPQARRFNPCFDGSEARVAMRMSIFALIACFNPCFDGSEARVLHVENMEIDRARFQSLF